MAIVEAGADRTFIKIFDVAQFYRVRQFGIEVWIASVLVSSIAKGEEWVEVPKTGSGNTAAIAELNGILLGKIIGQAEGREEVEIIPRIGFAGSDQFRANVGVLAP